MINNLDTLAQDNNELISNFKEIRDLCGQILATLHINLERGTIKCSDDNKELVNLCIIWQERFNRITL